MEPILRRKFQLTNLDGNNNKWWMVELWPNNTYTTTWGRVGVENPQSTTKYGDEWAVESKIREKLAKGYVEVQLHKPSVVVASTVAGNIDPKLAGIVNTIFQEAGENIASYLAVGVDALSEEQISMGRRYLSIVQSNYEDWQETQSAREYRTLASNVQQFFNTIPTKLPHRIDKDSVVYDLCQNLSEYENRLNQLEAAVATMVIQRTGNVSNYDALGAKLEFLPNGQEYQTIADTISRTSVHGYRPRVHDILRVEIPDERKKFEQDSTDNPSHLFHGTRGANVRHILRSGLIIPRNAANGSMFGRGIYFANKFSKSANYCSSNRAPYQFLFLVEVKLGRMYIADTDMGHLTSAPSGHDSVWGKEGHTRSWGGRLNWDEFIVYRPSQQTIRYLVLFGR